ncbi:DUF4426 domain-containing protein [Vulcaniibacterium tengchongense]|uniref:Uncharacterized protein DUF4426 n=1 Tax=Vulcaniibacterium tengchongense TaxID=1273429 RepID=A0A3N4VDB2_9GAMM|nr:DUF4426 domain-containing protein [Vulcaniibacterium tengchongense]RPE80996.1 uncharacterized protein DUF4426 [Vulcaniibacterium tengchongense]
MKLHALPLALLLAACTAAEAPRPAQFVPPAPAQADFGDLRVHYNALPTLALGEAVARDYAVRRRDDRALLMVALRRVAGHEETTAAGEVSAVAVDLQGRRQAIAMRPVRSGAYVDHIGTFEVAPRDSYRLEVTVATPQRRERFGFQRNF